MSTLEVVFLWLIIIIGTVFHVPCLPLLLHHQLHVRAVADSQRLADLLPGVARVYADLHGRVKPQIVQQRLGAAHTANFLTLLVVNINLDWRVSEWVKAKI